MGNRSRKRHVREKYRKLKQDEILHRLSFLISDFSGSYRSNSEEYNSDTRDQHLPPVPRS